MNPLTQQLNHIQPLQKPFSRLESVANDPKSSGSVSTVSIQVVDEGNKGHKEPPVKKQKLLNGAQNINPESGKRSKDTIGKASKEQEQGMGEQFWSERLLSVSQIYFLFSLCFCFLRARYGLERTLNSFSDICTLIYLLNPCTYAF